MPDITLLDTDARRHIVLTGKPKKTKRDEELEEEIDRAVSYNEPLLAARRQYTAEARKDLREAAETMQEALGINKQDSKKTLERRDEIQKHVEKALGSEDSSEEAKKITDTIMRQVVASNREITERTQRERNLKVLKAKVGERLSTSTAEREPIQTPVPDVSSLVDMTAPEQEAAIVRHFDEYVEQYFEEPDLPEDHIGESVEMDPSWLEPEIDELEDVPVMEDEEADDEKDEGGEAEDALEDEEEDVSPPTDMTDKASDEELTFDLGDHIKPLDVESEEQLEKAVESVKTYWDKRHASEQLSQEIKKVPLAEITPSTIGAIKAQSAAPLSLEDVEDLVHKDMEKFAKQNTALALYDAIGEHWNNDVSLADTLNRRRDSAMQFHLNAGASSALAAIGKELLGTRYDASRLIKDGNIEMAAAALALEVGKEHPTNSDKFSEIVDKVRDHNAINQRATEIRALQRHSKLSKQYKTIQEQKAAGELLDKIKISGLEVDNLIEQRTNLGAALGSLQASATFYDQLDKLKGVKRAPILSISVGGDAEIGETIVKKLGLKKGYDIDISDPNDITLHVGMSSLSKYMKQAPDVEARAGKYEELKTSMKGVGEDANGNLIVDDYDVPGWNKTFDDGSGNQREYKWRVEQRNDIEWLKEATSPTEDNPEGIGGGLITRVTGAGKTNTALGFFANKLADNPDYKGMVVVPRGRSEQWFEEATKFSKMKVELIPDGTAKAKVDELLSNSAKGTIYVMGHREAARSHETIGLLQSDPAFNDGKFSGMVIDEPQELQSRGQSGNIGAFGKRLMKLQFNHRVGLTATPARRNPVEAYDLIKVDARV